MLSMMQGDGDGMASKRQGTQKASMLLVALDGKRGRQHKVAWYFPR
jgi:hypothetical protein